MKSDPLRETVRTIAYHDYFFLFTEVCIVQSYSNDNVWSKITFTIL